jgi:hypothetical protein
MSRKYKTQPTAKPTANPATLQIKPAQNTKPKCGLCGKTSNLTKTECCDQWICDDEDQYRMFSFARNSCSRNHRRYTVCGHHYEEDHAGSWQNCPKCRQAIETELYVNFATNEYNFEKLKNPPAYKPTQCAKCGAVIKLDQGGYSIKGDKYFCEKCTNAEL